jgi:hypothetical protein
MQSQEISELISAAHSRQRQKYVTFSNPTNPPANLDNDTSESSETSEEESITEELEDDDSILSDVTQTADNPQETLVDNKDPAGKFYFEPHFQQKITEEQIRHALEHAMRHGFDIQQLLSLDVLQINQFVAQAHVLFRKKKHAYPNRSIEGFFDPQTDIHIPDDIMQLAIKSLASSPEDIIPPCRFYGIESVTMKHFKNKPKLKGSGRTAAILNQDMHAITLFLEYILSFHAFCKYSSSLPPLLRDNFENVHDGGRSMVRYIERQFYRGDDTVDFRTTKFHCH